MAKQADTPEQRFTAEQVRKAGVILGAIAFGSAGTDEELRREIAAAFDKGSQRSVATLVAFLSSPEAIEVAQIVAEAAVTTMLEIPDIVRRADRRGEL